MNQRKRPWFLWRVCDSRPSCGSWRQHRRCVACDFSPATVCWFCLAGRSAEERATCPMWRVLIGSLKADRWIDPVSGHLCGHEARFPGGTLMRTWAAVWPLTSEEVWSGSRPVDQLISSLIQTLQTLSKPVFSPFVRKRCREKLLVFQMNVLKVFKRLPV